MSKANYVIGIPIDWDDIQGEGFDPRLMSDKETYEYYCKNKKECKIYHDVKDFFSDLNEDRVDTENMFWFNIEIKEDCIS